LSNCAKPIINSLPEKYKEALIKTTFEKVSQKDLANQLGLSHSAIKSRVQRGRDMVKAAIIDCCNPITDKYGNIIEKEKCKNECGCD
jgi:RNA polymerase sigma-70 factor (ECF subfamily)